MNSIVRVLGVGLGICVAASAALIFLPFAGFFGFDRPDIDPELAFSRFFWFLDVLVRDDDPERFIFGAARLIWTLSMMICVLPVTLVALIGEITPTRSLVWYSGGAGVLGAVAPWVLRAVKGLERASSAGALETRLAGLFFLTGAFAGFLYWLMVGKTAGLKSNPAVSNQLKA